MRLFGISDKSSMSIFPEIISQVRNKAKGQFARNIFTMGTGTIIAQSIPILASPLLTRIYSPAEYGIFANFLAIMAFLLVFFSGKYELAIILPKTDKEAINILSFCLFLILISASIFSLISLFAGNYVESTLHVKGLGQWLWLVPIAALIASTYIVLNEWYIRKKNFIGLSKNRVANTAGITSGSLGFGILNIHIGLILGQIIGQIFSVTLAVKRILKDDKYLLKYISPKKMFFFAKRYIDFAKFVIPGQIINTIAGQLAILLITANFGLFQAGILGLVDRIFGVPSSIIGSAITDVFKQRVSEEYKQHGSCLVIYRKVLFTLIGVSIIPFTILFLVSPYLFSFVFGTEWAQAGLYARILSFMYLLNFISMPTRWLFIITENQKLEMVWQIIFLVLTIIPLSIGIWLNDTIFTVILWGAGRSLGYLIFVIITYNLAKGKFRNKSQNFKVAE